MTSNKIYTKSQLIKNLITLRRKNIVIGFTNGCFDLLHKGHLKLISEAKNSCDYLIVAVNSDKSIKSIKGNDRPIQNQDIRTKNLSKIKEINAVIIFEQDTPLEILKEILPNILFKGSDYRNEKIIGSELIKKIGGEIIIIDLLEGYSTTNIINETII